MKESGFSCIVISSITMASFMLNLPPLQPVQGRMQDGEHSTMKSIPDS